MLPLRGDEEWKKLIRNLCRLLTDWFVRGCLWADLILGVISSVALGVKGEYSYMCEMIGFTAIVALLLIYPPKILPKDPL